MTRRDTLSTRTRNLRTLNGFDPCVFLIDYAGTNLKTQRPTLEQRFVPYVRCVLSAEFTTVPYMGTSLIRKRPPPKDHRRTLGITVL